MNRTPEHPSSENRVHIIQTNQILNPFAHQKCQCENSLRLHSVAALKEQIFAWKHINIDILLSSCSARTPVWCPLWSRHLGGPSGWWELLVQVFAKKNHNENHFWCTVRVWQTPNYDLNAFQNLQTDSYLRSHVIVHGVDHIVQQVDV